MSHTRAETVGDELDRRTQEQPPAPAAGRVALAVLCLALLLGGFYLMGYAFDHASSVLFTLGILVSGSSFFLGMHRPGR